MAKYLRKKTREENRPGYGYALPFFAVLAVLTVVSFIIPLRPTQSYSEKRNLAEFPEFSVDAVISGDYFDDITTWFSDTFPGRESWIRLSDNISAFHGYSEITIEGDIMISETVPATAPPRIESTEATEVPAQTESEGSVDATEQTQAAGEEENIWGGVQFDPEQVIKIDSVIQIGDSAFSSLAFSASESERYTRTLSNFADL